MLQSLKTKNKIKIKLALISVTLFFLFIHVCLVYLRFSICCQYLALWDISLYIYEKLKSLLPIYLYMFTGGKLRVNCFTFCLIYVGFAGPWRRVASHTSPDGEECQHQWSTGQTGRDLKISTSVNQLIYLIVICHSLCE